jgi:hypothetical protein
MAVQERLRDLPIVFRRPRHVVQRAVVHEENDARIKLGREGREQHVEAVECRLSAG